MLNCEKQNVKCEIVRYKTMGALTVIICRILFILSWFRASGQHFQGHFALKLKKKMLMKLGKFGKLRAKDINVS